jgi:ribosomal protein S18 acetylase RimI-like enzyme
MIYSIKISKSKCHITECANMMASSPPWNLLFFSREQCVENLNSDTLTLYVAESDDKLVGFLATRSTGMEGEPLLEYICVDSSHRGQGLGSNMLRYFEDDLYPDADNLYLFVSDINPQAIKLYERFGYVRVGELPDYNLVGQTEFLYRKYRRPRQERFRSRL